jgi:hypothetical protein
MQRRTRFNRHTRGTIFMPMHSTTAALAFRGAAFAVTLAVLAFTNAPRPAIGAGPFDALAGTWSGSGSIALTNGTSERIRCRVEYDVGGGGNSVQQQLRCASDSYKFDLSSSVRHQGGAISGTWTESNRGIGGNLQGRASGSLIEALVETGGFSATIAIQTRGNQQSVSMRSAGDQFREVSITLRKGGR